MLLYKCRFEGIDNPHQYEEMIKVFLPKGSYEICSGEEECRTYCFNGDRNELKKSIYRDLQEHTGKSPKWGILTGIRPVKMAGEMFDEVQDMEKVKSVLENEYLLNPMKSELVSDILQYQRKTAGKPEPDSISVYIGIPFCPTRCLYCSFTSNQVKAGEMDRYLEALFKEIEYCGGKIKEKGYKLESLYIGGGTPTSLDEVQFEKMLAKISECFQLTEIDEYTVEAGRPDTITPYKLEIMKKYGVGRISINPQTMKDETLKLIGRDHTVQQTEDAFRMAHDAGIECINTDLIAGLPEETLDDFKHSLDRIIELGADNITLHTLAVKRASRLKEYDAEFNYKQEDLREQMLNHAYEVLKAKGYVPYYLYRQKNTSGNTENIGFCRNDSLSVYNIRIMEEAQSILALGAGGISKVYYPEENRLERVPNVSNYEIYIERIDEMIQRKEDNFWR